MTAETSATNTKVAARPRHARRPSWPVAVLRTARPRQWPKNLLVFAAPLAAPSLGRHDWPLYAFAAAGAFLCASIAVYFINDVADAERDRLNLVFMGQGEPFLNYDNFMQAVRLLVQGVGIPESRMTVSTSGIVPRITDFGAEPVRPKLAVSLNAPNEELRTRIMPITKKWTIEKLMAALRDFPLRNRERLTFEYVLLGGINDDVQHAREVVELMRGLRAKVNLIALNAGPEIPFTMPLEERVLAFQGVLTRAGIPTFIRRPRGRDIYAACGQLKHTTELVQLNP